MDTMNWAEKQNKFCDEWVTKMMPIESWNRKVEHKASFALEGGLPLSQDLRYCSIYKHYYQNSMRKDEQLQYINWKAVKEVMACNVTIRESDYLEAISIIRFIQSKHKKTLVVVVPPLLKDGLWTKFKNFHLSSFLSELEKLGVPCYESLNDEILHKAGRYVLVFSVATSKDLLETVLHDYIKAGKYKHNGFMSLSILYGERHYCLKNVYPVG